MFDIIPYLAFLLIFAICSVIGLTVLRAYNTNTSGKLTDSYATAVITDAGDVYTALDYAYLILVAGLIIGLVASAFFIQTHPAFFIINVVMLVLVVVISAPLSDVFSKFSEGSGSSNANITSAVDSMPYTENLALNFPLIATVAGAVFFIALYAKVRYT